MVERRINETPYSLAQIKGYLSWLAKGMVQYNSTVFQIEDLRLSWLKERLQRRRYFVTVGLVMGLFDGVIVGATIGGMIGANLSLLTGVVSGLVVVPIWGMMCGLLGKWGKGLSVDWAVIILIIMTTGFALTSDDNGFATTIVGLLAGLTAGFIVFRFNEELESGITQAPIVFRNDLEAEALELGSYDTDRRVMQKPNIRHALRKAALVGLLTHLTQRWI